MKTSAVLSMALLAALTPAQATLTPKQVYDRCRDSVVSIEVETPKGKFAGTGFFYENGLTVATSLHVVANATAILIRDAHGGTWRPETLLFDASADVVLLRLWQDSGHRGIAHAPSNTVHVGDPVFVIGDPLGLTATLSTGIVSALREDKGVPYVQLTAAISHGSSGSPILDASARVLGVAASSIEEGQSLNLAVSTRAAKRLTTSTKGVKVSDYYALAKVPTGLDDASSKAEETVPKTETAPPKREAVDSSATRQDEAAMREALAGVYSDLLVALARWDAAWANGVDQSHRTAIRSLGECNRGFVAITKRAKGLEAELDAHPKAVLSPSDRDLVLASLAALGRIAKDRYDAESECLTASTKGGERFDAAERSWNEERQRLERGMGEFAKSLLGPSWIDGDGFNRAVSPQAWAALFLIRFDAIPDLDLIEPWVVQTYKGSRLRPGDRITGIRRADDAEFSPIDGWPSVKDFLLENQGDFQIRIVRSGVETVVGESRGKE